MATSTAPLNTFVKFCQFAKLEDGKDDDAPVVWGISTWEQPDSDAECCDFDSAVPVYQAWSAKALKRTKGAGQEASLGNVRLMHGSEVGGKVTKITYDDKAKEIWLGSEPISPEVHKQLKKGFFTGYSQGGSYAWRECNECQGQMPMQQAANFCPNCNKNVVVRYGLKRLAEVSYVDSPATGEGFEHVKANGSTEILKFAKKEIAVEKDKKTKRVAGVDLPSHCFAYVGDPEKTETWKLPIEFPGDEGKTKRHIRNALARFEQTQGIPAEEKSKVKAKIEAAARSHGIEVDGQKSVKVREMLKARIDALAESKGFAKGMYAVSRAADMLESLACLYEQSVWEREIEGDESEVPDELGDILGQFAETFLSMATEEATELAAQIKGKTSTGEKAMTPEELAKQQELEKAAKKSLASHFAKAASHHEKMADMHEALADEHEEAAEHHEKMAAASECKCGKTMKADVENDEPHAAIHTVLADQQEFHKAMVGCETAKAKHHDKIAKAHDKHSEHLHKMAESHDEETAKAVKAEIAAFDAANPEPKVEKSAPVVSATPSIDEEIKKAAEAARNTPEHKAAIAAIAKAQVEAEVEELRKTTLAPLGTKIDAETGKVILKHLNIVPRDKGNDDFAFAGKGEIGNSAGL